MGSLLSDGPRLLSLVVLEERDAAGSGLRVVVRDELGVAVDGQHEVAVEWNHALGQDRVLDLEDPKLDLHDLLAEGGEPHREPDGFSVVVTSAGSVDLCIGRVFPTVLRENFSLEHVMTS